MLRSIVVEPIKLTNASQKMNGLKDEYVRLYEQLYTEVGAMGAAWKGKDNTAFVTQINGFKDDFQRLTRDLEEYSRFLKDSADKYTQAQLDVENEAKRLAN